MARRDGLCAAHQLVVIDLGLGRAQQVKGKVIRAYDHPLVDAVQVGAGAAGRYAGLQPVDVLVEIRSDQGAQGTSAD